MQFFNDLFQPNYYTENENILASMIYYFKDTWIDTHPNRRNVRRPVMFSINMWIMELL